MRTCIRAFETIVYAVTSPSTSTAVSQMTNTDGVCVCVRVFVNMFFQAAGLWRRSLGSLCAGLARVRPLSGIISRCLDSYVLI